MRAPEDVTWTELANKSCYSQRHRHLLEMRKDRRTAVTIHKPRLCHHGGKQAEPPSLLPAFSPSFFRLLIFLPTQVTVLFS